MLYASTDAPVRTSLDLQSTGTPNARVRLAAASGLPIAFRRVLVMRSGSFATRKWQGVTAKGTTALPSSKAKRLMSEATRPLN